MKEDSRLKFVRALAIDGAIGIVLTGLMLLYSQNFTFVGVIDATLVAGVLLFSVGWFFYISNNNVFDMVVYGVKSFWKGVFGKRMDQTYLEYIADKQQIRPWLYQALWLSSLVVLAADLAMYLVYKL